jgi:hypothetical protein
MAEVDRRRVLTVSALALIVTVNVGAQRYPPTLTYTSRGSHSEGLTGEPRTADAALALISAMAIAKPTEEYAQWPKTLRLRFFLPKGEERASVAVRQIPAPNGYYRLDNVKPPSPWIPSSLNEFEWPADVMARVYDFQAPSQAGLTREHWIAQLGVVVALGTVDAASARQQITVAPAALFHAHQPLEVSAYQFTFRSTVSAELTEAVLSESSKRASSFAPRSVDANSPFTTRWLAGDQPEGWYRLTLDASFKGASAGLSQQWIVRFYHRPSLARPQGGPW